jgi:acetyltransferase-like isoleucine patch superfamily enzyme
MRKIINFIAESSITQIIITLITYSFYAAVIGISLVPSVYLVHFGIKQFPVQIISPSNVLLFCFILGLAVYLYFITGVIIMGIIIRILSLGMKAGRYPRESFGMLRWLIYSGIYHIAGSTILNFIPMTFFTNLFFRLMGARIGKNVFINTWNLNDAYLMEIEDNVVIGGKSDLSCHTFEDNCLILSPIKIGEGTLIGTRCYISPGVTIGKKCMIGMYSFIRKNSIISDKTFISSLAGMDARDVAVIENVRGRLDKLHLEILKERKSTKKESHE